MKRRTFIVGMAAAATVTSLVASGGGGRPALAADGTKINTIGSPGVAIKGYDPVAYFVDAGPRKGSPKFSVKHRGVEWRFATGENKSRFEADPEKYMPAYGGYCAYGVAKGALAKIEPDQWTIRNGKLYLNYDAEVQADWAKDPAGYIRTADKKWPDLTRK
ncbi:MAG: hypothetical protein RLZ98_3145 [Pseudomonadota bacterium]